MAIDNDLSALMPDPPPPRPARREAAIELALRRFDGEPAPAFPARVRPGPAPAGWGRPQIAALASVALVVLVSVPVWWAERDRIAPRAPPAAATTAPAPAAAPAPDQSGAPAVARPPAGAASPAAARAEAAAAPSSAAIEENLNRLPQVTPAAPPAAADATAAAGANLSRRAASPPRPAAAQRSPAPLAEVEDDAGSNIVVTGSRMERGSHNAATPIVTVGEELLDTPGDWNRCTLFDPQRDTDACGPYADPAAPGARGRAAEELADGLGYAWRGDLDSAIRAFDRAIAAAPDLSVGYLNRALAYQQRGNLRRALADLDRAVARDRNDPRAYYYRSLLLRARGDTARAEADARRAIALDPGYRAVLP